MEEDTMYKDKNDKNSSLEAIQAKKAIYEQMKRELENAASQIEQINQQMREEAINRPIEHTNANEFSEIEKANSQIEQINQQMREEAINRPVEHASINEFGEIERPKSR